MKRQRAPWVIGHRGACGSRPENTVPSIIAAHGMGAEWVEVDVVLSADCEPVLSHDLRLEALTDVATAYPGRARPEGGWHVADFKWAELSTLRVGARVDAATGRPRHPGRVLTGAGEAGLCRLGDAVACLERLNRQTGRQVGLVVEVKFPAHHRREGRDIGAVVRDTLADARLPIVIETFDPVALKEWRVSWPGASALRWWQLTGENAWGEADCDYDAMRSPAGLAEISRHADGVVVNLERATPEFVASARAAGLTVCAYTLRFDETDKAGVFNCLAGAGLDGVFTDQPDQMRSWLARQRG